MIQILKLSAQVYQIDSYRYFCETVKGNLIYSKLDNTLKSVELSLEEWIEATGERVAIGSVILVGKLAPNPVYVVSSTFLQRVMA
jgi:hypothetical protein